MLRTLDTLIDEYLSYIEVEKDRSARTVRNYSHWLNRFARWATTQTISTPAEITPETIKKYKIYIAHLPDSKRLQKNTLNYHLIALRTFLAYLEKRGIAALPKHKVVLSRVRQKEQEAPLNASEAQRLYGTVSSSGEIGKIKKRDAAILALLLHTDLRVSEVVSLFRTDIRLHRRECIYKRGTTYHAQILPSDACETLQAYLDERKDPYPALFIRYDRAVGKKMAPNLRAMSLTPRSIQRIISRYARLAGIERSITPEVLRRRTPRP
ncbi:site-specific integrase [Candidatus Uhrbacteria bacterium]|nr:site-specific integrase [Candidatus Uhrbacteria bacterium]